MRKWILIAVLVVLGLVALFSTTAYAEGKPAQNISLGFGWRVLNYFPLRFPPTFTSDLRWVGVRRGLRERKDQQETRSNSNEMQDFTR